MVDLLALAGVGRECLALGTGDRVPQLRHRAEVRIEGAGVFFGELGHRLHRVEEHTSVESDPGAQGAREIGL